MSDQLQLCAPLRQLLLSDGKNRLYTSIAIGQRSPVVLSAMLRLSSGIICHTNLTDDLSFPASFRRNLKHISLANFSVTDSRGQSATAIPQFIFD